MNVNVVAFSLQEERTEIDRRAHDLGIAYVPCSGKEQNFHVVPGHGAHRLAEADGIKLCAVDFGFMLDDGAHNDNTDAVASSETFETFVSHIWNAGTTPEETQNIRGIVGDVRALREAHD